MPRKVFHTQAIQVKKPLMSKQEAKLAEKEGGAAAGEETTELVTTEETVIDYETKTTVIPGKVKESPPGKVVATFQTSISTLDEP